MPTHLALASSSYSDIGLSCTAASAATDFISSYSVPVGSPLISLFHAHTNTSSSFVFRPTTKFSATHVVLLCVLPRKVLINFELDEYSKDGSKNLRSTYSEEESERASEYKAAIVGLSCNSTPMLGIMRYILCYKRKY